MRAILGTLALLVGSLAVTLLVMEGVLRVAYPQWAGLVPQRFLRMTDDGVLAGVPNFDGRLAGLFDNFDVHVTLDERGFRNLPGAQPTAPLAFVGDSFCFGWGVEGDQAFPGLVATRLGVPAYSFCAVSGDLTDYLRIVQTTMPSRPNGATVLTITFENDVLAYPASPDGGAPTPAVQGLSRQPLSRWLMNHSALFNVSTTLARQNASVVAFVRRLGWVSGVPVLATDGTDPIAASIAMVRRIREAAGSGPFLVLMVPPRPGQVLMVDYRAFVTALERAGFDVLDPAQLPGLAVTTIPYDGHWDVAMHAAIVAPLGDRLARAGVR